MGQEEEYYDILGVKVRMNTIPVRPGRNIASICEIAAMNTRQRYLGFNAEDILNQRLRDMNNTVEE